MNAAKPAIIAMPLFLVVRYNAHMKLVGSELLCVRIASLLTTKDIHRVMSYGSIVVGIVNIFSFSIVQDICLALTTALTKGIAISLALTLLRAR